jgi:hypothetical protein
VDDDTLYLVDSPDWEAPGWYCQPCCRGLLLAVAASAKTVHLLDDCLPDEEVVRVCWSCERAQGDAGALLVPGEDTPFCEEVGR